MKNHVLALVTLFTIQCFSSLQAQKLTTDKSEAESQKRMAFVLDSVEKALKWENGKIELPGGIASIQVPSNLRYLNPEQSKFILTDIWGNPPGVSTLGMLFPANTSPLSDSAWAFNVNFDEMGFVKDGDADEINYDELLETIKKEATEGSKKRVEMGYEPIEIVGWASKPFYDKSKKVLHWAKEIKFGSGEGGNTLNYDMRFLGRKGVLSLNAISGVSDLDMIKGNIPVIGDAVHFNAGHRYEDFDSKIDDVAAWTIGGLVAGKVLAKAGFFVVILKFIKPILVALAALGAGIKRLFFGKKSEEEQA